MSQAETRVLTLGHSTHSLQEFATLLRRHRVTALADVRSAPYSRFNPQFNRETLQHAMKSRGIRYVFLGRELGARPVDPSCYETGRVSYQRLSQTKLFQTGLERVITGSRDHRIALVCAEKEPLECHRTLLVARALFERGTCVSHILEDGRLETHEAAMDRLLEILKLPKMHLFQSRQELIAEALERQEKRVAYVDDSPKRAVATEEE